MAKDGELVHRSLMETLEDDDEDITVRRRCLESVAPFNTEAIENFVEWAYSSEDEDLKSSSIYAMGRTGESCLAAHPDLRVAEPGPVGQV